MFIFLRPYLWTKSILTPNTIVLCLTSFNKQPSFTVQNPRLQLVKIDYVISVYLWPTNTILPQKIIYTYGCVFTKFKSQPILTKMNFIELLLHRKLSLSECTIKLFDLAGFLVHVQQFSRLLDKFEDRFLVKRFGTFLISFSVCFFKMKSIICHIYWIPDLQ